MLERSLFDEYLKKTRGIFGTDLSEADTKAYLIDPLLQILGYDFEHVRREVRIPATKEALDYELRVDGNPVAIIEAKAARHSVSDQHAAQCVQYASVLGVRWCLVTNGFTWAIYDAKADGALPEKKVAEVELNDADAAWAVLSLFSRDAIPGVSRSGLLIRKAITDALLTPNSAAFGALRKAVGSRLGHRPTPQALLEAVGSIVGRPPPVAPPSRRRQEGGGSRPKPGRQSRGLMELISAGVLPEDAVLEMVYKGRTFVGRLRGAGQIEVNGTVFTSLSSASGFLCDGKARDGWRDWHYEGESLEHIRQRHRGINPS